MEILKSSILILASLFVRNDEKKTVTYLINILLFKFEVQGSNKFWLIIWIM